MAEQTRTGLLQAFRCCKLTLANGIVSSDRKDITPLVAHAHDGTDDQKQQAARTLWGLAQGSDDKVAIANAGGIVPLVALARDGTNEQKTNAAGALASLAVNDDNKVAIANAGGIAPLLALAREGTRDQKTSAAVALANLAHNAESRLVIEQQASGMITPLVALSRGGTASQKTFATHSLEQLACDADNQAAIARANGRYASIKLAEMSGMNALSAFLASPREARPVASQLPGIKDSFRARLLHLPCVVRPPVAKDLRVGYG